MTQSKTLDTGSDGMEDRATARKVEDLAQSFAFLDNLRETGITNMYGARPYLMNARGLGADVAGEHLTMWMRTFSHAPRSERARIALQTPAGSGS